MNLGADNIGEFVTATAVGINGPEHGPDHAGVAGGFAQLIPGTRRGFAHDDVIHGLDDYARCCVSSEEADRNSVGWQRRKEMVGITSDVESMQQEFRRICLPV